MIRADLETIIMASGGGPSLIVLRERSGASAPEAPLRTLSIQTGAFEAASISQGIDGTELPRPITHELFLNVLSKLDVKIERVEINRYDAPVFFSNVVLVHETDGALAGGSRRGRARAVRQVRPDALPRRFLSPPQSL